MCFVYSAKWSSPPRTGTVRLTGGVNPSEGYVEVYAGNDTWYKICGTFGLSESNAVCKEMGYLRVGASIYVPVVG